MTAMSFEFPRQRCGQCGYEFDMATKVIETQRISPIQAEQDVVLCINCGGVSIGEDLGPFGVRLREPTLEELMVINEELGPVLRAYHRFRVSNPLSTED